MSEPLAPDRRLPIGLTITVAICLAILVGLGVWQLQRLKWKEGLLARIAALQTAPPQPIAVVLARAARGENVDFTRVASACAAPPLNVSGYAYGVDQGQMVWRVLTACRLTAGPYDGIVVDRGVAESLRGQVSSRVIAWPATGRIVGILRKPQAQSWSTKLAGGSSQTLARTPAGVAALAAAAQIAHPAPLMLVVEREAPAPSGITAEPLPEEIPNRHLEYALTWFGLAGVLACVYAAMLLRRLRTA